jgi:hypothetical protein
MLLGQESRRNMRILLEPEQVQEPRECFEEGIKYKNPMNAFKTGVKDRTGVQ